MDITSRDNRLVKEVRRLLADAKYRREAGLFAVEGARLCEDAALSGVDIRYALYTARAAAQYPRQLDAVRKSAAALYEIPDELARFIGDTAAPQGIFSVCGALDNCRPYDTMDKAERLLALEDIQDPANLGAVIRTAEALGLDGLLLSAGCCDVYNPKVLRGSMGGVFRLKLYTAGRFDEAVPTLQAAGRRCLACVPDAAALPVQKAGLHPEDICFNGNEGNGLRRETNEACGESITIPMRGRAESLNAAMAAGLVVWEQLRQSE